MTLSKSSPVPLYYQLSETIRAQVRSGELPPGAQLPSERELSDEYNISRMTVRQALAFLIRDGVLVAKQGLGTFVAEPKLSKDSLHLLGFTEEMMLKGLATSSRVLEQSIVTPPHAVASELDLDPTATTIKIVRLRLSDNVPMLLETVFVPSELCPALTNADLVSQSLYSILELECGLHLSRARQTIEPTVANEYEAQVFDIPAGTGMLLVEGVTYTSQDTPVEYFKAIYRGDRFKFELESQRGNDPLQMPFAPRLSVRIHSETISK